MANYEMPQQVNSYGNEPGLPLENREVSVSAGNVDLSGLVVEEHNEGDMQDRGSQGVVLDADRFNAMSPEESFALAGKLVEDRAREANTRAMIEEDEENMAALAENREYAEAIKADIEREKAMLAEAREQVIAKYGTNEAEWPADVKENMSKANAEHDKHRMGWALAGVAAIATLGGFSSDANAESLRDMTIEDLQSYRGASSGIISFRNWIQIETARFPSRPGETGNEYLERMGRYYEEHAGDMTIEDLQSYRGAIAPIVNLQRLIEVETERFPSRPGETGNEYLKRLGNYGQRYGAWRSGVMDAMNHAGLWEMASVMTPEQLIADKELPQVYRGPLTYAIQHAINKVGFKPLPGESVANFLNRYERSFTYSDSQKLPE